MKCTSIKEIEDEFEKKKKAFQDACPHRKTKWFMEYWAIAHATGKEIRVCLRCNKTLEKR
jgi:hypothetical protein